MSTKYVHLIMYSKAIDGITRNTALGGGMTMILFPLILSLAALVHVLMVGLDHLKCFTIADHKQDLYHVLNQACVSIASRWKLIAMVMQPCQEPGDNPTFCHSCQILLMSKWTQTYINDRKSQ